MKFSFISSTTELKSSPVTLSTLLIAGRVSFVNSAISQLNLKSPCGLMVEHRSAKREGLRFVRFLVEDSSSLMLLLFYS